MSDAALSAPLRLGIDLGTSAVKIVAIDAAGATIGAGAGDFPTHGTLARQAEQAPTDWLAAIAQAMRLLDVAVAGALGPAWTRRVAAIGLTGQLPTLVCLSGDAPLAPAITWKDGRADAWAAARIDAATRARMYACTGMPIDARYLAPMLQFHFAARVAAIDTVLSAKDYLLFVLTGLRSTEPSTAAGYGVYDLHAGDYDRALCEFWSLPHALLPRIRAANSLAGPLSAAGAALLGLPPGIPVSTGAADSVCAAYAMAGLDERLVSISFGSSAVVLRAGRDRRLDPAARFLLTPHAVDGWYGREMDLLATGSGYRWLSGLFGWRGAEIDACAADSPPGARGLIFPPYLAGGEQGALWNPHLQGALLGLTLSHARCDVARAYLEGVCYELRRCVEVLAEASRVESVRVSGNIVESPGSLQMLADVLDRPVAAVRGSSPAALGAALLAGGVTEGAGVRENLAAPAPPVAPNPAAARLYADLYERYLVRAAQCC